MNHYHSEPRFENFVGANGSRRRPVSFLYILLSNIVSPYLKMADVVLLVSELKDDLDF